MSGLKFENDDKGDTNGSNREYEIEAICDSVIYAK